MLNILVNKAPLSVPENSSLLEVLPKANITDSDGIAIAVNKTVCPKGKWAQTELQEGDDIVIITATQGG